MNIFEGYDANLPTQLWIAARYLHASSFLMAFLLIYKKINPNDLVIGYTFITAFLVILIFTELFPVCYSGGLTPFKIISEYVIIGILAFSLSVLYKNRSELDITMFYLIIFSILSTMIAELAFTFYIGVYDLSNLVGHIFKIISFYLIYLAIIQKGLEDPLHTLFTRLKKSEDFTVTALNAQMDTFFVFNPKNGKAISLNKNWGEPYLLIGQIYAESKGDLVAAQECIPKAAYWIAVDKFIEAKKADPSVETEANKLIATYSKYFPSKEDAFFCSINEGDTYKIGSWINEITSARFEY